MLGADIRGTRDLQNCKELRQAKKEEKTTWSEASGVTITSKRDITLGLHDLKGLFQPKWFYDSISTKATIWQSAIAVQKHVCCVEVDISFKLRSWQHMSYLPEVRRAAVWKFSSGPGVLQEGRHRADRDQDTHTDRTSPEGTNVLPPANSTTSCQHLSQRDG